MSVPEWSIVLSYATAQPPTDAELGRLADAFDAEDVTVSARPDRRGFEVYLWVAGGAFERVAVEQLPRFLDPVARQISRAGVEARVDGARIRSTADVEAELARPRS